MFCHDCHSEKLEQLVQVLNDFLYLRGTDKRVFYRKRYLYIAFVIIKVIQTCTHFPPNI